MKTLALINFFKQTRYCLLMFFSMMMMSFSVTASAGSGTVILIVNSNLQPEIQDDLNRMKADMQIEGYTVKIKTWPSTDQDAQHVWVYLKSEYATQGQTLTGAILIGNLPMGRNLTTNELTDWCYWNMNAEWRNTYSRQIWVSRFFSLSDNFTEQYYGDEVALLKRSFKANHEFRTGKSRFSWMVNNYVDPLAFGWRPPPISIPNHPTEQIPPDDAWLLGGCLFQESSHGNVDCYGDYMHGVTLYGLHSIVPQMRFFVGDSCGSGALGTTIQNQILARDTGNVLSIGASETTFLGSVNLEHSSDAFRNGLAAGETWGNMLKLYNNFEIYRLIFYGDLSLALSPYPAYPMPTLTSFTADKVSGAAPLTVNFSAHGGTDPAGGSLTYNWYCKGTGAGKLPPTATGTMTSQSCTYTIPRIYSAHIEAVNAYQGRVQKDIHICVAPDSTKPFRVMCGRGLGWGHHSANIVQSVFGHYPDLDYTDSDGNFWLYTQRYESGSWGFSLSGMVQTIDTITGTRDPYLFQDAGFGRNLNFKSPFANGRYLVRLGFAELETSILGDRVFNVSIQGAPWLTNFDIIAATGSSKKAVLKSTLATVTDGFLNINLDQCTGSARLPLVNTIEVIPIGAGIVPTANIITASTSGRALYTFNAIASVTQGSVVKYEWNFGDGTVSLGSSVNHIYTSPGTYQVELTVTDAQGLFSSSTKTVTINPSLTATTLILQQGLNGYIGAKDTQLDGRNEFAKLRNYGGSPTISALEMDLTRTLAAFDLSPLPANSTILSAKLEVHCTAFGVIGVTNTKPGWVEAHQVTSSWIEGTRPGASPADGATWLISTTTTSWGTPGGDIDPVPLSWLTESQISTNSWLSFNISDLARKWQAGSITNNGVALTIPQKIGGNLTLVSKENANAALRPKLVIIYETGTSLINHTPMAMDQNVTIPTNSPATITLNGSDADNNDLTYIVLNPPSHGTLTQGLNYNFIESFYPLANGPLNGRKVIYTPNEGYNGIDQFTFEVSDGKSSSNISKVTINIGTTTIPSITSFLTATGTVGTPFNYSITGNNNPTSYGAAGLPAGLSVKTTTGVISGTPTENGTFNVRISATNGSGTGSEILVLTIHGTPFVTSLNTTTGYLGASFSYTITAANNPTSYGATNLPAGLIATSSTGIISGRPTVIGTFNSTIKAMNTAGTNTAPLTFTIYPAPIITSATNVTGFVGATFGYVLTVTNHPASVGITGILPSGLHLNTLSSGLYLNGTPTATGTFYLTLSASNPAGTDTKTLGLTINPTPAKPVITSALTSSGMVGIPFTYTITGSNSPTGFQAIGLPSGLSYNFNTGIISGTPKIAGTFNVTLNAHNAGGWSNSATLVLTINASAATPSITSVLTSSGIVGTPYSYTITASNTPTSFGATNLPAGLTLNTSTGVISGTPTVAGTNSVIISASNSSGSGSATLVLTIATATPANTPPTVATPASASPNPVSGTTTLLSALGTDNGGEANLTYTWATTGVPPAPVSFIPNSSNTAKNSAATFTKSGTYNFQVTIKDVGGLTVTSSRSVTINQTLTSITVSPVTTNITVGGTQVFTASGKDQFGTIMPIAPTWTVSGGGTISAAGIFAAATAGGPFTVTASSGGKSGTTTVTVTNPGNPGLVFLRARDQNGIEVPGAQIYVSQKSTWYPTGSQIQLVVGSPYNIKGKSSQGVEGTYIVKTVDSTMTEIAVPFQKVTLQGKDQFGTAVAGATIGLYNVVGSPFALGSQLTLPRGAGVYTQGIAMGLASPWNQVTIIDGMTTVTTPFWKTTVRVKNSSGVEILGSKVQIYNATAGPFATGSSVTLGKGTAPYTRAVVGTSYGPWIKNTFTDGLNELVLSF
jgi:PKD repeat protein